MDARRESTERTKTAILQATVDLLREKRSVEIVLADIAERAGSTVQTILRHFTSKDGLFDAAQEYGRETVTAQRDAPVGDLDADIRILIDHYELWGDAVIHFLGQETEDDRIRSMMEQGRAGHRKWVTDMIGPLLARPTDELIDQLVVVTDVYTWKLLRRDRHLSRTETESRMLVLARSVIAHNERN